MGYNIEIYGAITIKPPLPGDFVLAAMKQMRGGGDITDTELTRWPALSRLNADVPFDIVEYRTQAGELGTYIECEADNNRPYDFEDHLDALRGVLVDSCPGVRFSGSMHWRGEESPDEGWIAIEPSGNDIAILTAYSALGVPLPAAEAARAALRAAAAEDEFTAWLDLLLAIRRAEAGEDAPVYEPGVVPGARLAALRRRVEAVVAPLLDALR